MIISGSENIQVILAGSIENFFKDTDQLVEIYTNIYHFGLSSENKIIAFDKNSNEIRHSKFSIEELIAQKGENDVYLIFDEEEKFVLEDDFFASIGVLNDWIVLSNGNKCCVYSISTRALIQFPK